MRLCREHLAFCRCDEFEFPRDELTRLSLPATAIGPSVQPHDYVAHQDRSSHHVKPGRRPPSPMLSAFEWGLVLAKDTGLIAIDRIRSGHTRVLTCTVL
jgi:hypothetical protein